MRELIQNLHDSDSIASNVFRNIQTLGKPSHCENMWSSEGRRHHEKASYTPTTLLQKPSDPVYHSASLLVRRGCLLVEEELLLYALVCTSFPWNVCNIKAKSADKYGPIIYAIGNVFQINFKNHDLRIKISAKWKELLDGCTTKKFCLKFWKNSANFWKIIKRH